MLKLTEENYYSREADSEYLSNSQLKDFEKCEGIWFEKYITGEWSEVRDETPLIVGNYVGTAFESEEAHKDFIEKNKDKIFKDPTIDAIKLELGKAGINFKKTGKKEYFVELAKNHNVDLSCIYEKKSDYILADKMIETGKNDALFMEVMSGAHEQIFTAELFGHPFKVRLDVFDPETGTITDLKTTKDFEGGWIEINGKNVKVPFYEAWNYHRQLAIYQAVVYLATGVKTDFHFIAAITKQDPPDKDIFNFSEFEHEERFAFEMDKVEEMVKKIILIKAGKLAPEPCGKNSCKYCRNKRVITDATRAKTFIELHTKGETYND